MVTSKIIVKANSVEQAIAQGLEKLKLKKDQVEIEIINEGDLFTEAEVALTPDISTLQKAQDFINELFELMKLRCFAEAEEKDNKIYISICGTDSASVIGYRGEVLDALQYLAVIVGNVGEENGYTRVIVDAENYRGKRNDTLTSLAGRLAIKASSTGQPVELEPMNPFERRIIHTALQDSKIATTISEGEGFDRHVVIVPSDKTDAVESGTSDFSKKGPGKLRKFGYNNRRF